MNKVFRIIWNSTLGRLVVASEAAQSRGKSSGQRLQVAPAATMKASPAGVLRSLVVAVGLAGAGAVIPTAIAENATYDNLTVTNAAVLSALEVSGAATFTGSLTVGGESVATAADITGISTNESAITALDGRVDTNETDITGLDTDLGNLDTRVGDNETAITGLNTDLGDLDTRVGDNESAITGLNTDLGDLDTRVGDNESAITDLDTDLGDLDTRVGDNETAITGLDGRVDTNETDIETINTSLTNLGVDENNPGVKYFRASSEATDAQANGSESVAIGPNSVAGGDSSLAAGDGAQADGASSLAAGNGASTTAEGEGAIALGQGASAGGANTGDGGAGAIAVGRNSTASSDSATALGDGAEASGGNASALGAGAQALGGNSIALGQSSASSDNAFAAGNGAKANSPNSISLGTGAGDGTSGTVGSDHNSHIAIGKEAGQNVVGKETVAIGFGAGSNVDGDNNTSIGTNAGTGINGEYNIAMGFEANSGAGTINHSTVVGGKAAAGSNSVALGYDASATGSDATAVGNGAQADSNGLALGSNASAGSDSVALGNNSSSLLYTGSNESYLTGKTSNQGVVSVGNSDTTDPITRRIVNVADGAQGTDAVNVNQLKSAQKSVANLVGGDVSLDNDGVYGSITVTDTNGNDQTFGTVVEAIGAVTDGTVEILPPDAVKYNADGGISNVEAGVDGKDVVNVEQLNQEIADKGVKYFSANSSGEANENNTGATGADALAVGPRASAQGDESLALGFAARAEDKAKAGVAIGTDVRAEGEKSTVLGNESRVYDNSGVAIGHDAESNGENSLVMGTGASSNEKSTGERVDNAIVIGTEAKSTASDDGVAIGRTALAKEDRAVAQGFNAESTADDAMAFGSRSRASGVSSQASGTDANASGVNAQASGTNANASGFNAIAQGTGAKGYATDGIAMGTGAEAGFSDPNNLYPERNTAGIAIGKTSKADEEHALALGVEANARAKGASAIGDGAEATASAEDGLAVGSSARVTAQNASAFGQSAEATAQDAAAFGSGANATASGALASGGGAKATETNASAIGKGANAKHAGSVALGSDSETAGPNPTSQGTVEGLTYGGFAGDAPESVVSVGSDGNERQVTNVAAGRISGNSTDAINGSQLYATQTVIGNVANSLADGSDSVLGGNASVGSDGVISMSDIGGTGEDTVHDAIGYAAQGWDVATSDTTGTDASNVAPEAEVDFVSDDGSIVVEHTRDADSGDTSIDFALGHDLSVGGPGEDGADGEDGYIGVNGADGVSGVGIDGSDGSIGLTGPAGADGTSPELTMRPSIEPGDVAADDTDVTRLQYVGGDGKQKNIATLEDDGLRFSGNENPADGYVTRNMNEEMQIVGGAENADTASYSSDNVNTVATQEGGIEIQFADTPSFQGADMGGEQITNVGSGKTDADGNDVTDLGEANPDNAANIGDLQDVNAVANAGWDVATSDTTDLTSNVSPEAEVDFVSADDSIVVEHTRDDATGNTSIDFALGHDLSVGGPGEDGADGEDGYIGVNGADGVSGVGIDGSDGSIGLTGPAGADGTSPELTMHPGIEPGDVAADDTDVTRLQYEDGDGNQKNIATLEDDGLRFSGNENPADGYVTRNLNKEMQIVGGAEDADTASYSSGNVNTVATQDGGIEIQFADTPSFQGADMGGEQVTSLAKGKVGENSTDAVNGSQLWKIKDIANAGWNVATSNTTGITTSNVAPEATVDFVGSDGNVVVEHTRDENTGNTSIDYTLNDSITLGDGNTAVTVDGKNGKVSVGDTIMDGEGLKIANGGPSVTVNGIDAGGMQITNVASGMGGQSLDQISGDDLMNAVNVGDLKQVAGNIGDDVAAAKTEVTEGKNITVTELEKGEDGQTRYEVATKNDVNFDSIEINEGGPTINKDGIDMGENKITGLAPGEVSADSTDAVNGSQLHGVKEEIGDINSSLDGGMDFAADEGDDVNRELGDTLAITGDDNITTRTNDGGVEVGLNRDLDVDSVTTGKTTVSNEGVTIEDGPSMTTDGIDAGDMRITNVAPGVDATDAVNVGQMQELNQRFAQEINNVHGRINDVEDSANAGTASALAAATVPQAWMPGKSMVGVGAGTYEGESAVSVGVSRLSDNGRWVIQGKVTGDSQSNFGAGVGAGWHW